MKFKDGSEIKEGTPVVGVDWRNCPVEGTAIKGDKAKGHDEFVFLHGVHKTVCPSLTLDQFLPKKVEAKIEPAPAVETPVEAKIEPAPAIAEA